MTLGASSDLTGIVTPKVTPSDLAGTVLGGRGPSDLTGTVSRALVESWDSPSVFFRADVKLGDEWILDAELAALPSIDEGDIDSHTGGWTFGLRGKRWSVEQTEKVFARTPVEIYLRHGLEGAVIESATPDYAGYVIGCDQGGGAHEPMLVIQCGDEASKWEKHDACEEIAPGAGYTRGEIVELLCAAAGIPVVNVPAGAVYDKPLQAVNKRVFEVLKPFVEPEGWRFRCNGLREVEIWTPEIKRPPLAPDWAWTKADIVSLRAVPPEDAPSRWVLTANTVVDINELGVVTETTTSEVQALYAPAVAVRQQQTDGSDPDTGFPSEPEALRVISRIVDVVTKQAGQVVGQRTTEYGWRNLRSARLASNASGSGGGYNFLQVYIDDAGNYVAWQKEKFLAVGERVAINAYNGNGDLIGQVVQTARWRTTEQGVRAVGTSASATTVLNAYVHGDGQSYLERVEVWGIDEEQRITYQFRDDGPLHSTTQETWRYFNPRTKVEHGSAHPTYFVLYNGEAHKGQIATWRRVELKVETNIIGNALDLRGTQIATSIWKALEKKDGPNNFGTYKSNAEEQAFQLDRVENNAVNVISEDQYEVITYPPEGGRVSRIFLGRVPTTRYQSSTWTRLLTQPREVVVNDPVAEAWFGFEREVYQHDYVQNAAEATRVILARRRRAMATKLQIVRPDTAARRGDTVHFSSPEDGIEGRYVVTHKTRDWSSIMPVATFALEKW